MFSLFSKVFLNVKIWKEIIILNKLIKLINKYFMFFFNPVRYLFSDIFFISWIFYDMIKILIQLLCKYSIQRNCGNVKEMLYFGYGCCIVSLNVSF